MENEVGKQNQADMNPSEGEIQETGMKSVNIATLIVIALIGMGGIAALAFTGVFNSASQYTTFAKAKGMEESVHVVGSWVRRDQSHYDIERDIFQFYMQDTANVVSLVQYHDPQPVNFETAERIVIEGQYQGDVFEAERILMKCPSKYNEGEFTIEEAKSS